MEGYDVARTNSYLPIPGIRVCFVLTHLPLYYLVPFVIRPGLITSSLIILLYCLRSQRHTNVPYGALSDNSLADNRFPN